MQNRSSAANRKTKETEISASLLLEGSGSAKVKTGIGFLDHMLESFTFHGSFDLEITANGDLHVCPHHTIEDVAIVLGKIFHDCWQQDLAIQRFAHNLIPMDETLIRTAVDLSGRAHHHFDGYIEGNTVGEFPIEMVKHFFSSFTNNAKITLHQSILYGENAHHKIEGLFKSLGKALKNAIQKETVLTISSVKGSL